VTDHQLCDNPDCHRRVCRENRPAAREDRVVSTRYNRAERRILRRAWSSPRRRATPHPLAVR
jgi:hypothetical protein